MERTFAAPYTVARRMGADDLDAYDITAYAPEAFAALLRKTARTAEAAETTQTEQTVRTAKEDRATKTARTSQAAE